MFNFESLKVIQVEITSRCQASCPMCLRNIHGGIQNNKLPINDWNIDDFKHIFNRDILQQIEHLIFCGDFGDPLINDDLIYMCDYIKNNSNIQISISTNGSARNQSWWKSLAEALPKNHMVTFALDGLQDTHSLYRIGTIFDLIIRNAKIFIKHGGNAEWMFIRFKHNQHQIEEARRLAHSLGFSKFTVKTSKRFGKKFPVLDELGNIIYYIEQPSDSTVKQVDYVHLKNYKEWKNADKINCFTINEGELYIDANMNAMPCCLIGSFLYANYDLEEYKKYNVADNNSYIHAAKIAQNNTFDIIKELGGLEKLNLKNTTIKQLLSTNEWQTLIKNKWTTKSSIPCIMLCSEDSPYMSIASQIINHEA